MAFIVRQGRERRRTRYPIARSRIAGRKVLAEFGEIWVAGALPGATTDAPCVGATERTALEYRAP